MKKVTILRLTSILLILTLMIGMIPAASASNEVYFPVYAGNSSSIVDALRSLGIDPSYQNRERIAAANGIRNYTGSASENTEMLEKLRAGILIDPNGKSTVSNNQDVLGSPYYPACEENFTSIVDALNSIGVDASFDFRCKIAEANQIYNYRGTSKQNIQMLNLLKDGNLKMVDDIQSGDKSADVVFIGKIAPRKDMVEVTKSTTVLREKPMAKGDDIFTVQKGDCFEVLGSKTNRYGNLWYKVSFAGSQAWIYSGHCKAHIHNYIQVIGCDTVSFCTCGAYIDAMVANTTSIGADAATADTFFGVEEGFSAAAVALSGEAAALASAAFPYIAIAIFVSGLIILTVSASGCQVGEAKLIQSEADLLDQLEIGESDESYYASAITKGNPGLLIFNHPMDVEGANTFLINSLTPTSRTISEITKTPICSVYTYSDQNAIELCERFSQNGSAYSYGTSKKANGSAEQAHAEGYYQHYHLWYEFHKSWGTHIIFGLPLPSSAA